MIRLLATATLAAAAVLLPARADAALFCVRNANELRAALDTAESNGQDDEIRIARGTYVATSSGPFAYASSETRGLHLVGGWVLINNQCVLKYPDGSKTILDGNSLVPALHIEHFGDFVMTRVRIEGLTLRAGRANAGSEASGLAVYGYANNALVIDVDRVIVQYNFSLFDLDPAVSLVSDFGHIRFTNSIVRGNLTQNASAVHIHSNHGGSTLDHLSVLDNIRQSPGNSAIDWSGNPHLLSNSVFFGNMGGGGYDIGPWGGVLYRNVRYGIANGGSLPGTGNSAIADPMLDADERPSLTSPLHSAGVKRFSRHDVYGRDRLAGGFSDIGAAEAVE